MKPEQLYLKLNDDSIRPKFDTNGINKNSIHYVKFKSKFLKWLEETDLSEKENKRLDDIIIELLKRSIHDDGYRLAKYLEDSYIFDPDYKLIKILNDCYFVRLCLETEKVNQWVKECHLTLSTELIGKHVNYKLKKPFGKFEQCTGYITKLFPTDYRLVVSNTIEGIDGQIVNAEDILLKN